ncbi:hypothetical protein NDU88_003699, partial [Pleurodeles waltl]
ENHPLKAELQNYTQAKSQGKKHLKSVNGKDINWKCSWKEAIFSTTDVRLIRITGPLPALCSGSSHVGKNVQIQ